MDNIKRFPSISESNILTNEELESTLGGACANSCKPGCGDSCKPGAKTSSPSTELKTQASKLNG